MIVPPVFTKTANPPGFLFAKAVYSQCKNFRYTLEREWQCRGKRMMVIGLNPSTATHVVLDPTITRLVSLAKREGGRALLMTNLFAYRATDPKDMRGANHPVGICNDSYLHHSAENSDLIVFAWGNHGNHLKRASAVVSMLKRFQHKCFCLGVTQQGHPKHPLYLSKNTPLIPFYVKEPNDI